LSKLQLPRITSPQLVTAILQNYSLQQWGTHGLSHWARVLVNGLTVAAETGADTDVVALFAVFHDSRRDSDAWDPKHGPRGARLAEELCGLHFKLDKARLTQLVTACEGHTHELTHPDITVATCWDGDRLDLARVGRIPLPKRMATDVGRQDHIIQPAVQRSNALVMPEDVRELWRV
jgi:uncharacterized protein